MKYIILLLFFCQTLRAQELTLFSTEISILDNNLVTVATIPIEDGILATGIYHGVEGYRAIYLTKTSYKGEILWLKILDDAPTVDNIVSGSAFIFTNDGHFAVVYSKFKTTAKEDRDIVLMKFMANGMVLWTQTYGNDGDEAAYHLMQTKEGGYLITGFQEVPNDNTYYYVIKTQEGGFELWDKKYKWNGYSHGFWTAEDLDEGYIVSGYAQTNENEFNFDIYIVKIDANGNEVWGKNYGGNDIDEAAKIFSLPNGNFVLSGGIQDDNIDKLYHAEIDENGIIVWQKEYQINRLESIQSGLIIREDGSFMGVAVIKNEYDHYQPLLMNFSSRGDTLWTKPITFDPHSNVYIRDIEPIEGGYVLAGFKHSPIPQHGWLVTIDEEGNFCEELGCVETVVDIEDIAAQNSVFVQVSPNPVREQATIQYQIPKDGVLKVYDYQGRLIEEYTLVANERKIVLDLKSWTSGVYLYSVEIEGERIEHGKILCR